MKKRYYAGIRLQEDFDMCKVYDELDAIKNVKIIKHGRDAKVIEMKYDNAFSSNRIATGKTHIGFDYNFIIFNYKGLEFHINPSTYYPFTDENYPGKINFTVYKDGRQCSYNEKYESFVDIKRWVKNNPEVKPV